MKVGLKTGVDVEIERQDVKEQAFIQEYFKTAELIWRTKEALKGYKHDLEQIYVAYLKYQDEKRQGKLFE